MLQNVLFFLFISALLENNKNFPLAGVYLERLVLFKDKLPITIMSEQIEENLKAKDMHLENLIYDNIRYFQFHEKSIL